MAAVHGAPSGRPDDTAPGRPIDTAPGRPIDMAHLTTVAGAFHARVLAARLGAEGVLAQLRGAVDGPYPMGAVAVYVPADELVSAREILVLDEAAAAWPDDDPGPARRRRWWPAAAAAAAVALVVSGLLAELV